MSILAAVEYVIISSYSFCVIIVFISGCVALASVGFATLYIITPPLSIDVVPNPDNVIPDVLLLSPIVLSMLFLYIFSIVISSIYKSNLFLLPMNSL